jgi:hypothetical protein
MNEVLKIEVQAQVQQATAGLKQLQGSLKATEQAAKGTTAAMPKLGQGTNQATAALTNFGRVASDAPFGLIGIANNIEPLIQSFVQLKSASGSTGGALKALGSSLLGGGGLILGISLLTSAAQFAVLGFDRWSISSKKAKEAQDKVNEAIGESIRQITKQKEEVSALANVVKNNANSEEVRSNALKRLNEIIPDTVGKLTQKNIAEKEGIKVIAAYIKALEAQATAELLIGRIAENNVKLFENRQNTLDEVNRLTEQINSAQRRQQRFEQAGKPEIAAEIQKEINSLLKERENLQKQGRNTAEELIKKNQELRDGYEKLIPKFDELFVKGDKLNQQSKEKLKDTKAEFSLVSSIGEFIAEQNKQAQERIQAQKDLNLLIEAENKLRKTGEKPPELTPQQQLAIVGSDAARGETGGNGLPERITVAKELTDQLQLSDQLINSIAGEFADLFSSIGTDGVKSFKDIAKAVAETTSRILIQYAVTTALKALLNSISGGVGGNIAGLTGAKGVVRGGDLSLLIGRGI